MKQTQFSEVAHLYLGCTVMDTITPSTREKFVMNEINDGVFQCIEHGFFKPVLRPLSDMTNDEHKEWLSFYNYQGKMAKAYGIGEAKRTVFLLSKHFDLFDLIPNGFALDSTTLK